MKIFESLWATKNLKTYKIYLYIFEGIRNLIIYYGWESYWSNKTENYVIAKTHMIDDL